MKFKYTIMYVPDVAKTLAFYEQAFGLEQAFLHESGDYGELSTGDTKLAFSSLALMTSLGKHPSSGNPASPNFEIAFETDDVAGNLAKASKRERNWWKMSGKCHGDRPSLTCGISTAIWWKFAVLWLACS